MYRKELSKAFRNALNLSIISVVLVGCLDQAGSESGFVERAAPTGTGGTGNNAPTISGNPPTAIDSGNAYSFTPVAVDPDGDPLSFSVMNLPSWAEFDTPLPVNSLGNRRTATLARMPVSRFR